MDFRRIPRKNRKECFRFLENVLDRAYHKGTRFFRTYYFRFLPSKPEVIVPVLCNIKCINDDFPKTNFSPRNLLIQRSLRCETSAFLCWTSGLGEVQQVFWSWICKIGFKNCKLVPACTACHNNASFLSAICNFQIGEKRHGKDEGWRKSSQPWLDFV